MTAYDTWKTTDPADDCDQCDSCGRAYNGPRRGYYDDSALLCHDCQERLDTCDPEHDVAKLFEIGRRVNELELSEEEPNKRVLTEAALDMAALLDKISHYLSFSDGPTPRVLRTVGDLNRDETW